MNRLLSWFGVIAISSLLPTAAFGQCVEFDKPEDLFALSDAVFIGTVVAKQPTGGAGAHAMVEVATLRVERSWKGGRVGEVGVASDGPLAVKEMYLVFAAGTPLSTSVRCRWTEPVDVAKRKLDWLSRKGRATQTPLRLPVSIEVLRDVPAEVKEGTSQRRGVLYVRAPQAFTIKKGERIEMVKTYSEGSCRIRFKGIEYDVSSCPWMDGFTNHQEDVFRVVTP